MTLKDDIQEQAKGYGVQSGGENSDFFKMKDGANKVRVLNQPTILALHFFGKGQAPVVCVGIDEGCEHHKEDDSRPTLKLVTYIIDRDDENKVKLAELPLSVGYSINKLEETEDWTFAGYPMPYDITITHNKDASDPKEKYSVAPSPKMVELTEEEQKTFDEKMENITPGDYVDRRKAKAKPEKEVKNPTAEE